MSGPVTAGAQHAQQIQDYWTDRARSATDSPTATTQDVHMRRLEGMAFRRALESLECAPGSQVVDIGCGDGRTTVDLAAALPDLRFTGVDYSEGMIENAQRTLVDVSLVARVGFRVGNVLQLNEDLPDQQFDAALTCRCLINLASAADQQRAVAQIAALVRPGGHYIAIENFTDGQEQLNHARAECGLPPIPVRWHNLFFEAEAFERAVEPFFVRRETRNFASAYYLATRVMYSRLCRNRGEEPDYLHEIHRLSVDLPDFGNFSPVRMVVLERKG